MKIKLLLSAFIKLALGFVICMLLLFLPVGTFNYPNAWLFLGLLFIPMIGVGIILFVKSPELFEKRMALREKEKTQRGVIAISGLIFIIGFIVTSLDFKYGWSNMTKIETVEASILFLFGYIMYMEVLRENKYLSRTVEVQDNQEVIDTGLYAMVRHPMYLATILMFLAMPLVLGSKIGLLVFIFYPFVIRKRIENEEAVLEKGLKGYSEYKKKVKYRLIPYVW